LETKYIFPGMVSISMMITKTYFNIYNYIPSNLYIAGNLTNHNVQHESRNLCSSDVHLTVSHSNFAIVWDS